MSVAVKKPRGRPKKIPIEVEEAIALDLREEGSLRTVAARYGVSPSTVQRVGKDAGIALDHRRTEKATRARIITAAASRALLSERFLEAAHNMLDLMNKKYEVYGITGLGDVVTHHLKRPQAGDMRSFMQAATYASDRHIAIARFDSEAETARSDVDLFLKAMSGKSEASVPMGESEQHLRSEGPKSLEQVSQS